MSPIGRIKHKKSVYTWKKKNKSAISEYNKKYYRKKKHIILYNKKTREETESVMIFSDFYNKSLNITKTPNKKVKVIEINPKPKEFLN